MELDLLHELGDTSDIDCQDHAHQERDEHYEGWVIVSTDARAKPHTVVIELSNAVIAQVAMGGFGWSEDQTGLAILETGDGSITEFGT